MNTAIIIAIAKLGPWGCLVGLALIAALCVIVLELISQFFKINDAIKKIIDMKTQIAVYDLDLASPLDYVYPNRLTPEARKELLELEDRYQAKLKSYKELHDKILESFKLVYPEGTPGARSTLYRWLRRGLRIDPAHNDDLRNLKGAHDTLLAIGNDAKRLEREDFVKQRN